MSMQSDDRVVELVYDLVAEGRTRDLSFATDAPTLRLVTDEFEATLEGGGRLTVRPRVRFTALDEAARALELTLREWEMYVALQAGWPEIRFVLRSASIIDEATGRGRTRAWSNVVGPVRDVPEVRSTYPEPPRGNFSRSGEADILFARWESVVRGRESLTSAAYAALTVVEGAFGEGDRPKAAQALRISANVLDLIGTLSAQGDPATARKITSAPQRPLTEAERVWLEAAFECSRCAPVRWPQRGMLGRFVS